MIRYDFIRDGGITVILYKNIHIHALFTCQIVKCAIKEQTSVRTHIKKIYLFGLIILFQCSVPFIMQKVVPCICPPPFPPSLNNHIPNIYRDQSHNVKYIFRNKNLQIFPKLKQFFSSALCFIDIHSHKFRGK